MTADIKQRADSTVPLKPSGDPRDIYARNEIERVGCAIDGQGVLVNVRAETAEARVRELEGGWISVEAPPSDMRLVNICMGGCVVATGWYNHGKKKWRIWGQDMAREVPAQVTDWRELPSPPVAAKAQNEQKAED